MRIHEIKAALHTLLECEVYISGSAYMDTGWYWAIIQCVDETVQGVCTVFLYCPDLSGGADVKVYGRGENIRILQIKQPFGIRKEKEYAFCD